MTKAFNIVGRAIALWWKEFIILIFFNIVWLVLQIPVVTGPPATAAMYNIANRLSDDELIYPRDGWEALRQMFNPAIKWGIVNLLIFIPVVVNFWAYQDNLGIRWVALRLAWGVIALAWFAVNLFYWPFWLAQEDPSLVTTLRNGLLFMAKRPAFSLTLCFLSAGLIVLSILTTLPLVTILMAWLAFIGVLAVKEELKGIKSD